MFLPAGIGGPGLTIPSAATVWSWAPVLLANCCMAFGLNVSIALLIKNTSPTSYIFVGVIKDIIAILVSVMVLNELVSTLQVVSFTLQIGAVIVWSMLKMHPEKFEDGILQGVWFVLSGERLTNVAGDKLSSAQSTSKPML